MKTLPIQAGANAENRAAMYVLVWSDRHPLELRLIAMDRLIQEQEQWFWASANRWWPSVESTPMAAAIGERAVDGGRIDVIPGLLRRWAQARPNGNDPGRMEPQVFEQLVSPISIHQALWQRVGGRGGETAVATEQAMSAWVVLCQLEAESARRRMLMEYPGAGVLWADLRAAADLLDHLPETREGLRWLTALRSDERFWNRLKTRKKTLQGEAAKGWEIRHAAVLAHASDELFAVGRGELRDTLTRELFEAARVSREQAAGDDVLIERGRDLMWSWPDLALISKLLRAMDEPGVVRAWFDQADADLLDTGSEYGGVLIWNADGSVLANGFTPEMRRGDRQFFSSPALIQAMYMGLAHYHFHAQQYDNAEYAGPGRGDLEFTGKLETHALTLTFVNRDQLNIDLSFPDGRVLDLGCVDRPSLKPSGP